jgi:dTDP-4-dehydrorhamnose reductase
MKRTLLVIGAKGMLGRDLVGILHSSFPDDEVIGWDVEEIDIQKEGESVFKIGKLQPHIIIHIAAYTDVDGCERNEEKAFAVNAEGTRHVALAALRCRAKLIYLSTDYVFDGNKREPYVESDLPHPLNTYGRSKWQGEQYAQELVKNGLVIRTQWLYGRYGKNFVATILHQAREKKMLSIVNDQIGSPTYTVDLAKAISALIQFSAQGIFHVANSDQCTWFTFGKAILNLFGMNEVKVIPISSEALDRPAVRPSYSVFNCQKLREKTGLTLRPWSEALKDYLRTFNPNVKIQSR